MTEKKQRRRRVKFEFDADRERKVFVAGTFNDWNPAKNRLKWRNGRFSTSILLFPGRYEYKFVVDGVWCVDPHCAEWIHNEFGSLNSVRTVD